MVNINHDTKDVTIDVYSSADLAHLVLHFVVPEGATLQDKDGTLIQDTIFNFSMVGHSQQLTVTSEDKVYKADYNVKVRSLVRIPLLYHFERLVQSAPYHILEEIDSEQGDTLIWQSGNPGYQLTMQAKSPEDYPTVQVADGYAGRGVKLETRSTGGFGAMVKMYIAAGNLFIGSFSVGNALNNALKATRFGMQFGRQPIALRGYYKYKAGAIYTEAQKPVTGKKDRFDIYAIMYEADDPGFMLDGTNALTDPSLVGVAQIAASDAVEAANWTKFDLPFVLKAGKSIDKEKLRDGKYKLGIVFSSSVDGGKFSGAVGSTLYIDEVELVCEEEESGDEQ
jgi:hypothetical protein